MYPVWVGKMFLTEGAQKLVMWVGAYKIRGLPDNKKEKHFNQKEQRGEVEEHDLYGEQWDVHPGGNTGSGQSRGWWGKLLVALLGDVVACPHEKI